MTPKEAIEAAQERSYDDPPTWERAWDDPVEREAIILHALSYMTPEAVASAKDSKDGREQLLHSWSRSSHSIQRRDRHLYRRRAVVAGPVFAKRPGT